MQRTPGQIRALDITKGVVLAALIAALIIYLLRPTASVPSVAVATPVPAGSVAALSVNLPGSPIPAGSFLLTGKGAPNTEVEVKLNGVAAGKAPVSSSGNWSFPLTLPNPGNASLELRQLGANGTATGNPQTATLQVVAAPTAIATNAVSTASATTVPATTALAATSGVTTVNTSAAVVTTTRPATTVAITTTAVVTITAGLTPTRSNQTATLPPATAAAPGLLTLNLPNLNITAGETTLKGNAPPNSNLELLLDGQVKDKLKSNADGTFNFKTVLDKPGIYQLALRALDGSNKVLATTAPVRITVETANQPGLVAEGSSGLCKPGADGKLPRVNGYDPLRPADVKEEIAFTTTWQRVDEPVVSNKVTRPLLWGSSAAGRCTLLLEPYNDGTRLVLYHDKSRMEVNSPNGDRSSRYFVTNGLMVKEMIEGKLQVGDDAFVARKPAEIAIIGTASDTTPTYDSFGRVGTFNTARESLNRTPNRVGQTIKEQLNKDGAYFLPERTPAEVKLTYFEDLLGHNVASVFWDYFNRRGVVNNGGNSQDDQVVIYPFDTGFPISEPFWIKAVIDGTSRDVLVQPFEKRMLTYTLLPEGGKVDLSDVGRHYFRWRNGGEP